MPLYEYKCDKCGAVFEVMQKFSDEPLHVHNDCGGNVERLISAPAFQFKGSGWYVTDYGGKGNGSAKSESSSKGTSDSDSKTETKSEAKPAESKPASSGTSKSE
ncbi:MAG TPA: FmdB family zinc ribbon protein [Bryobacteraceae bacterium]